ncbi:head-tail connector protein [Pseudomonas sp. RTC3]|uniref:head-tail connector protein n=1 Tax=unclassified Pseudomonas TaxID=196821 RepID=UPI002AB56F4C|nr:MULTISPECIES: head-tail connector protein [unclassified Pseudomonas]MEB0062458.1 head-tail connector protein [Pseudomonas sp. RTC3]MDY7565789.1 head-tail connector protein [Pseudomonas sp. 5C2]MEB0027594.1 head-tail connector protein [Pseudomonas sp. MH9.2]MEB0240463.1 head-tail connector protein [Pseudomonas sp. 5C2]WPX70348.1 head-tail connector protein [Pseudomonas sp. MH9.2]
MTAITVDVAMQHLRAEQEDSDYVVLLLEAAEDSAAQFLNRHFYADQQALDQAVLDGVAGTDPILINPSVRAACLLILGSLFESREDVIVGATSSQLPMGSRSLLTPYRIGWGV